MPNQQRMGPLLSVLLGIGVALAFVLVFWLFLNFICDMQRQARRHQ